MPDLVKLLKTTSRDMEALRKGLLDGSISVADAESRVCAAHMKIKKELVDA